MLPATYQIPAAICRCCSAASSPASSATGCSGSCWRIFGFILGALAASSVFGVSDTGPMMVAAVVGGLIGAGLLIAAYFVGVALVGAALGAVAAN